MNRKGEEKENCCDAYEHSGCPCARKVWVHRLDGAVLHPPTDAHDRQRKPKKPGTRQPNEVENGNEHHDEEDNRHRDHGLEIAGIAAGGVYPARRGSRLLGRGLVDLPSAEGALLQGGVNRPGAVWAGEDLHGRGKVEARGHAEISPFVSRKPNTRKSFNATVLW